MTRTPFDQFSKQYLQDFLSTWGQVTSNQEVPGEAKFIDLWFVPFPQPNTSANSLGLLGRFATTPCLLEPFRNSPSPEQVCSCLYKLFHVRANAQRQSKREKRTLADAEQPRLWILAPSASDRLLNGFNLREDRQRWGAGLYFWCEFERAALVAINQLPTTPDTLWVRLLGRGATQAQAIEEILALPKSSSLRANALELLTVWKINMEINLEAEGEERELAMVLSKAYLEWKQETEQQALQRGIQQGLQQGLQQERQATIEQFLTAKFGGLDDRLAAIVQPFAALPSPEYAALLMQVANLSREELLARFNER